MNNKDNKNPMLVTTSLLVDSSALSEEEFHQITETIFRQVNKALDKITKDLSNVTPLHCHSYIDLNPEENNCFLCENCGTWTTNFEKPNEIHGLPDGRYFEGMMICNQCECWKHDPNYGWEKK